MNDLMTKVHDVRQAVEFYLNDEFDGVDTVQFQIPSYVHPKELVGEDQQNFIAIVQFIATGDVVAPFLWLFHIEDLEVSPGPTLLFSGHNNHGYPFSGSIAYYDDITRRALRITRYGGPTVENFEGARTGPPTAYIDSHPFFLRDELIGWSFSRLRGQRGLRC